MIESKGKVYEITLQVKKKRPLAKSFGYKREYMDLPF